MECMYISMYVHIGRSAEYMYGHSTMLDWHIPMYIFEVLVLIH